MRPVNTSLVIQNNSATLRRCLTLLLIVLSALLVLERFGWVAMIGATQGVSHHVMRRIGCQLAAACPEVLFLLSLWWIRQALATFARGDLDAPVISRMLNRVGAMLAAGAVLNVFVVPSVQRALGAGPGYWIAFDVTGLVLGALGLYLAIVARLLDRARELKAELDGIF